MTNCSDFPRAFGTLPAGSAVRVKSRFALYSARGVDDLARVRPAADLLSGVSVVRRLPAERFALEALAALERFDGAELEEGDLVAFVAPLLRAADFLVARLPPDRGPARLVAMPFPVARSMPSTESWDGSSRRVTVRQQPR
jgi:hypothetical protein